MDGRRSRSARPEDQPVPGLGPDEVTVTPSTPLLGAPPSSPSTTMGVPTGGSTTTATPDTAILGRTPSPPSATGMDTGRTLASTLAASLPAEQAMEVLLLNLIIKQGENQHPAPTPSPALTIGYKLQRNVHSTPGHAMLAPTFQALQASHFYRQYRGLSWPLPPLGTRSCHKPPPQNHTLSPTA